MSLIFDEYILKSTPVKRTIIKLEKNWNMEIDQFHLSNYFCEDYQIAG